MQRVDTALLEHAIRRAPPRKIAAAGRDGQARRQSHVGAAAR
jgi:hypothetical protein